MPPRRGKKPVVLNSDSDIEIVVPSPAVSRIRKAPKRYSPNPSPVKPSRREPSASVAPPQQQLPSPPRLQPSPAKSESPAPPAPPPPRLPSRTVSREAQQLPVASTSAAAALPSPPPPRQSSSAPVASTSRVKLPVPRVKAKPKPKTKEVNSDDALDTFFTRKPVAKGRVPQSRRPGAVPAPAAPASNSDTPESGSSEPEDDEGAPHSKPLNLPAWTRGTTGAARLVAKMGSKPNRKKRRVDDPDSDEAVAEGSEEKKEKKDKKKDKISLVIDSDEEEEEEEDSDDSFGDAEEKVVKRKGKGRGKQRSTSLSPPVTAKMKIRTEFQDFKKDLDLKRQQKAKAATLELSDDDDDAGSRTASPPPVKNKKNDDIDLDPDLDPEFAEMLRRGPSSAAATSDDVVIIDPRGRAASVLSSNHEEDNDDVGRTVTIRISMVWDPDRDVKSIKAKEHHEKAIPYTVGPKESFQTIFSTFAAVKNLPETDLVFTHKSHIVYSFGNASSLQIFHLAEFRAYTKEIYEHAVVRSRLDRVATGKEHDLDPVASSPIPKELPAVAAGVGRERSVTREASFAPGAGGAAGEGSPGGGRAGLFKISVRGSEKNVLSLAVKPTTTVATLLRRYCKHFEVPQDKADKAWAEFDGERIEGGKRLEEVDELEEEETIDVRGL